MSSQTSLKNFFRSVISKKNPYRRLSQTGHHALYFPTQSSTLNIRIITKQRELKGIESWFDPDTANIPLSIVTCKFRIKENHKLISI